MGKAARLGEGLEVRSAPRVLPDASCHPQDENVFPEPSCAGQQITQPSLPSGSVYSDLK